VTRAKRRARATSLVTKSANSVWVCRKISAPCSSKRDARSGDRSASEIARSPTVPALSRPRYGAHRAGLASSLPIVASDSAGRRPRGRVQTASEQPETHAAPRLIEEPVSRTVIVALLAAVRTRW